MCASRCPSMTPGGRHGAEDTRRTPSTIAHQPLGQPGGSGWRFMDLMGAGRGPVSRRSSSWLVAVLLLVGAVGCSSGARNHTHSTARSPAPSVSAARGTAAKHYVPRPIPAALVALDVSWVSRSDGWLI